MKPVENREQNAESFTKETEAKEIRPDDGILIDENKLTAVSGGCGVVNRIIGDPQCDCSGEYVDMVAIGSDATGRITYYQCPLCGKTENVYG